MDDSSPTRARGSSARKPPTDAGLQDPYHWSLRVFCTVAEEESITAAGRRLMLGQPGVSMTIRRLEERYGARLIERRGKRVALTRAGAVFYEHALNTLRSAQDVADRMRAVAAGETESVTFASRTSLTAHFLPPILGRFWEEQPRTKVQILNVHPLVVMIDDVLQGGAEFAVLHRGRGVASRDLNVEPFHRERALVVAAMDHPLAHRGTASLEEISGFPFVVDFRSTSHISRLHTALSAKGLPFDVLAEVGGSSVSSFVRASGGLSLLLEGAAKEDVQNEVLTVIEVPELDIWFDLVLVYGDLTRLRPSAARLIELIREAGNQGGAAVS